eukprot:1090119-Rhodomonas_salina.1
MAVQHDVLACAIASLNRDEPGILFEVRYQKRAKFCDLFGVGLQLRLADLGPFFPLDVIRLLRRERPVLD